jgi:hypothetical protein
MLFDGDGNRMTLIHAVKGTRYRYSVSRPLITTAKSPWERAGALERAALLAHGRSGLDLENSAGDQPVTPTPSLLALRWGRKEPALIAGFEAASTAVALQRNTEMVWPDRHPEFPWQIVKNCVRGRAIAMCLHGLQNALAHWYRGCLMATSGPSLPSRGWCSPGRASSPPPPGRGCFITESRQNAFGDFQFVELVAQLCSLGIEPREPLGNPLLLLPNIVQCRHLLVPPRRKVDNNTTAPLLGRISARHGVAAPRSPPDLDAGGDD